MFGVGGVDTPITKRIILNTNHLGLVTSAYLAFIRLRCASAILVGVWLYASK